MAANNLNNFVPLNIELAEKIGLVDAAVAGAIWLKWNIHKKVCNAGTRELGRMLGMNFSTVSNSIKRLIAAELVEDLSPDRKGAPHDLIPSVDLINTLCKVSVDKVNTPEPSVDLINTSVDLINTSVDLINKEEVKNTKEDLPTTTTRAGEQENPSLMALVANYQDIINVSFSSVMADEFREYAGKVDPVWVSKAYKRAEHNNVRKWSYVKAILDSCIAAGRWVEKPRRNGHASNRRNYQNNRGAVQATGKKYADPEQYPDVDPFKARDNALPVM